ncbi:MAG: membrane protein insertion efficiency factor YidD [Acidobacteriota bacterium]|nr:membrane protein insertion efficiency factor YidD [Acidobacteriota bacterium]
MKTWIFDHPFLTVGFYLVFEALLPVPFQPSSWACRGAIRLYQMTLSSHVPTQCKFTPTCSHYGLEAVRRYGTLRGGLLTSWRLIRCSPLSHGGVDPVPGSPLAPEQQGMP